MFTRPIITPIAWLLCALAPTMPAWGQYTFADPGVVISHSVLEVMENASGRYAVILTTVPTGEVTVTLEVAGDAAAATIAPAPTSPLVFDASNWSDAQTVTVSVPIDDNIDDETLTIVHAVTSATDTDYHDITPFYEGGAGDAVTAPSGTMVIAVDAGKPPELQRVYLFNEPDNGVNFDGDFLTLALNFENERNHRIDVDASAPDARLPTLLLRIGDNIRTAELEPRFLDTDGTFLLENGAHEFHFVYFVNIEDPYTEDISLPDDALQMNGSRLTYAAGVPMGEVSLEGFEIEGAEKYAYGAIPVVVIQEQYSRVDESADEMLFTVRVIQPNGEAFTVNYQTVDGTATAGSDYTGVANGTLTVTDGELGVITIDLPGEDDQIDEGDGETFTVRIFNPSPPVKLGYTTETKGVIEDIDTSIDRRILRVGYERVRDEVGSMIFTVSRTSQFARGASITVTYATSDGTATHPEDYIETTGTLTFSDDTDYKQTVEVPIVNDLKIETSENLTLTLSDASTGEVIDFSIGDIEDDDRLPLTFTDAHGEPLDEPYMLTVPEGDVLVYAVSLPTQPMAPVTVYVNSHGGGSASPLTLVFTTEDWNVGKRVTFYHTVDDDGDDETMALLHTAVSDDPTYNSILGLVHYAGIGVTVDDSLDRGLLFGRLPVWINEGSEATYTMVLSVQPTSRVEVALAFDYGEEHGITMRPTAFTFSSENWNTPQTVTLSVPEDDDRYDDQAMITHTVTGSGYVGLRERQLGVNILDREIPRLVSVSLAADARPEPEDDGTYTYGAGEVIRLRAKFSRPVVVRGPLQLEIIVGRRARLADYASPGEEPVEVLDFTYTVQSADEAFNGIRLSRSEWAWRGASIVHPEFDHIIAIVRPYAYELIVDIPAERTKVDGIKGMRPTADAGRHQTVEEGTEATLDGSGSIIPEGMNPTYAWRLKYGDPAHIKSSTNGNAVWHIITLATNIPDEAKLTFELTVAIGRATNTSEVVITVRQTPFGGVLEHALARFGHALGSSAVNTLGERFSTPFRHSSGVLAVNLDGTDLDLAKMMPTGKVVPENGPALSMAMRGAGSNAVRETHAAGMAPDFMADHFRERMIGRVGHGGTMRSAGKESPGLPRLDRNFLMRSNFEVGMGTPAPGAAPGASADGASRIRWAFWGRFDNHDFETEPADATTLDGGVTIGYVGADARFGRDQNLLVGLAIGSADGDVKYMQGELPGDIVLGMLSFYPYASWAPSETLSLWGMFGTGSGDARITSERGHHVETDIGMSMLAAGGRKDFDSTSKTKWAIKGDAYLVNTGADDVVDRNIRDISTGVQRLRMGAELSRPFLINEAASVLPSIELLARLDQGDAETGFGAEIHASVAYANTGGLSAEARVRYLGMHSEDGIAETGFSVMLMYDPGSPDNGGPSVRLTPTWGNTQSVADTMWRGDEPMTGKTTGNLTGSLAGTSRGRPAVGGGPVPFGMNAEMQYDILLSKWSLTPYGSMNVSGNTDRGRWGLRINALAPEDGNLTLDFFGEQHAGMRNGRDGSATTIKAGLRATLNLRF